MHYQVCDWVPHIHHYYVPTKMHRWKVTPRVNKKNIPINPSVVQVWLYWVLMNAVSAGMMLISASVKKLFPIPRTCSMDCQWLTSSPLPWTQQYFKALQKCAVVDVQTLHYVIQLIFTLTGNSDKVASLSLEFFFFCTSEINSASCSGFTFKLAEVM